MNVLNTLDYALHYAALGIPVLPLQPRNKMPVGTLVPHGRNDATCDLDVIQEWFQGTPYNVGIITGNESGLFVLDRDDKDGGHRSLADLEAQYGPLPTTLTQQTGNGRHYFFLLPQDHEIRNSAKKLAPGLDVRGIGGYVVAAPSVHPNGNPYLWLDCDLPTREMIASAPEWMLQRISTPGAKDGSPQLQVPNPFGHLVFQIPDKIEDGQGREDFIVRFAGHLRAKGNDQSTIERILLDFNQLHIAPPLDELIVLDRAQRYEQPAANDPDRWPEPEQLLATLPPVTPFDMRLLPPPIRPWVADLAELLLRPPEVLTGCIFDPGVLEVAHHPLG
jgi:putative DNA primase/helicase